MEYVLIIHEVEDYSEWKKGFNKASGMRKSAGEIEYQVLCYEKDPSKVVHFSKWSSLQQAKDFFESKEVQEIRNKLGVKTPEFIYLQQKESGVL